jgi:hypothetical protein
MKYFLFLLVFFSFISLRINGQNLVPNPNFEDYTECPSSALDPVLATGWIPFKGTPDYFNQCAFPGITSVPWNGGGFQMALSGVGYGGLISLLNNNDLREILATTLSEPLEIGIDYYVEFYWSRAFGGDFHANCDCANSHLGALFTTQEFNNIENPIGFDNFAHVYDTALLEESTEWVKLSGWFTADSSYTHLALGNFFDIDVNELAYYNGSSTEIFLKTYYYIDDVCVATDPAFCDNSTTSSNVGQRIDSIELFPNPVKDSFRLRSTAPSGHLTVFNRYGTVVLNTPVLAEQAIDVSFLSNSLYLLEFVDSNGKVYRTKFVKM